ncbi:hypothetical protein P7C70_g8740, partial [Phenoliferia sp. Uapishka_3]
MGPSCRLLTSSATAARRCVRRCSPTTTSLQTCPLSKITLLREPFLSSFPTSARPSLTFELSKNSSLRAAGISAPYIPASWTPSTYLQVTFPPSAPTEKEHHVALGNELTPTQASPEPSFSFVPPPGSKPDQTYTVLCVDPDAPSKVDQKWGPVRHWVQGGVRVGGGKVVVERGAVMGYKGPGPPPKTGLHRYIFAIYRDTLPGGVKPLEEQKTFKDNELQSRLNWPFAEFVKENGLELLGMNFFEAQNSEQ